jgi:3-hydroxybutyryl-CoA dehydratase
MNKHIKEITIDDLKVGDQKVFSKTISESDIYAFAGITGDFAPQHVDAEFAKTTMFGERIAHGILTTGFISTALSYMVSPGGLTVSHEFKFLKPVRIGDTITAVVTVEEIIREKKRVRIRTQVFNQKDEMVVDGIAVELLRVR